MLIAAAGLTLLRSPLITIPLQSHSSKNGANIDTEISVIQSGASNNFFMTSSMAGGIGGMKWFTASVMKAAAIVAMDTINAIAKPPSCPKLLLSTGTLGVKFSFKRLLTDANSIAGININGYEMITP